jgi:hypothetical protein
MDAKGINQMKKYISLEHSIRNAVKDQNYKKKPVSEDFEFEMARHELRTAIDAAKRLMVHLDGEGELEAWVQSKITKASDYLDTVADYMDSGDKKKLKEQTEEIMEAVGIVGGEFKGRQFNNVVPKITPDSTRPSLKTSSVRRNAEEGKGLIMKHKVTEQAALSVIQLMGGAAKAIGKTLSTDAKVASGASTAAKGADEAQAAAKAASGAKDVEAAAVPKPKPVEEPVTPKKPEFEPYKPDTSPPAKTPTPANDPVKAPAAEPTKVPTKAPEAKVETTPSKAPAAAPSGKTTAPKTAAPKAPSKKLNLPIPNLGLGYQNMPMNISSVRNSQTYKSHAEAPRQFKEDKGEERKEIEYVARKDAAGPKSLKSTLGRTGSVQTKIIDENLANVVKNVVKKKKEEKESGSQNPLVDFEPKLNHTIRNEDYNTVSVNDNSIEPPAQKKSAKIIPFKKKTAEAPKQAETPKAPETPKATTTPTAPESTLSKVGKGALKVADKVAAPLQFGLDYYDRKQEGQSTGKAITGATSSTAGMLAGAKAGAALGTAVAPGVGTVIGGIGGAIGGAYLGGKTHDVIADKIEKGSSETEKPKADPSKSAALSGPYQTPSKEDKESGSKKKVNESSLIDAFLKLHG